VVFQMFGVDLGYARMGGGALGMLERKILSE
jgi:hypothetical protein